MGSIPGSGKSPGEEHRSPLQYSCLENPHGQRTLVGYSPQGHKESDMTEVKQHACIQSILSSFIHSRMTVSTFIIICDCPASLTSFIKETFLSPEYSMGHYFCKFSSVEFSYLVVSDSLRPHEPQNARPPCPSTTPRVHPNTCPLSR